MILKKITIPIFALSSLFLMDACKKCDDATNPNCSNYNSCASASKNKLHVPFELRYKEEVCFTDSSLGLINATIKFDSIDDFRNYGNACAGSLGGYADVYIKIKNNSVSLPDIVFGPRGCIGENEYDTLKIFQKVGNAKLCFIKLMPTTGSSASEQRPTYKTQYSVKILMR